jgi:ketosteroid isomerase-like protein
MTGTRIADLALAYLKAFERADRAAMEAALAPGFTFTSPYDDHISRDSWFERCWPHAGSLRVREPIRVVAEGNEAFVRYEAEGPGGAFANAELLRFEDGRLVSAEVFFGALPSGSAEAEDEIRALLDERIEALRVKDADRAVATLASDIVAFELAPPLALGPDQARDSAALEAWLAAWDGPVGIEMRDLHVAADGDVAWCRSLNRLCGTLKGGRRVDMWMRSTLGLSRKAGAWTIDHGHSSVPFHMDGSFRAATDLEP